MGKITIVVLLLILTVSCKSGNKSNDKKSDVTQNSFYISEILQTGSNEFDPWNKERWADWYNQKGELVRQFDIDVSVRFSSRNDSWTPTFSENYPHRALFVMAKQGAVMDGNQVVLDVRTEAQSLPLNKVYTLRKKPWEEGCEIIAIFYQLPEIVNTEASRIRNFTFKGWKRGVKINGTGAKEGHLLIVENCIFTRNRIGFYTNGYNTLLQNCKLFENGYGAIYSGSKSRRNYFTENEFRDNCLSQHQFSYADFIGDTFFDSEIKNNRFIKSRITGDYRRIGISLFRNMGESNRLRTNMPHNNVIRSNYFEDYSLAINVGARMGRDTRNDITDEGRDYAFYNVIDSNEITNTAIGIKVNTEGNTISNNIFKNVEKEIVLHCVFFNLKNTNINHQQNDSVFLWYTINDYEKYAKWFGFQDDLNGSIRKEEKQIEVFSTVEIPKFTSVATDIFKFNPSKLSIEHELHHNRVGAPLKVLSGEFSLDLTGNEKVAIWDKPISRINDADYYSILIFDKKGTEINRCGRSEVKWKDIAVGYFTRKGGEMQIAALPASPINGKFPVFIFDRGFRVPTEVRMENNTNPNISISVTDRNELLILEK